MEPKIKQKRRSPKFVTIFDNFYLHLGRSQLFAFPKIFVECPKPRYFRETHKYPYSSKSKDTHTISEKTGRIRWARRGVYVINLASVIVIDL